MSYTKEEVVEFLKGLEDDRTAGQYLWGISTVPSSNFEASSDEIVAAYKVGKNDKEVENMKAGMESAEKESKVTGTATIPWGGRLLDALEETTGKAATREGGRRRKTRKSKKSRKSVKKSRKSRTRKA